MTRKLYLSKYVLILLILILLIIVQGCSAFTPKSRASDAPCGFTLWMPGAVSVQLIGDWNEWGGIESAGGNLDPVAGRMSVNPNGIWEYEADPELPEGRYRYAFIIDGCDIIADPENPETSSYNGHTVSLLVITH